jgi:hypothetical protein
VEISWDGPITKDYVENKEQTIEKIIAYLNN